MNKFMILISLFISMVNGSELVDYKPFRVDTTRFSIPKYPLMANVDTLQISSSELDWEYRFYYESSGLYPTKILKKMWFKEKEPEEVFHYRYQNGIAFKSLIDTCNSGFCKGRVTVYEDSFENLKHTDLKSLASLADFSSRQKRFPRSLKRTMNTIGESDTSILTYEWKYDKNHNLQKEKMLSIYNGKVAKSYVMLGRLSFVSNKKIMRYIQLTNDKKKHYDSEIWVDCFDKNQVLQKKIRISETLFTPKYLIQSYTYTPDGKIDRIYHYNSKKNAYTKVELNTWDEQGQLRETHFYKLDKVKEGVYNAVENKIIKKEYGDQGRLVHEVELVRKD